MRKNLFLACCCWLCLGAITSLGQILIVDVTNVSAVKFIGTGAIASANSDSGPVSFPAWTAAVFGLNKPSVSLNAISSTLQTAAGHTLNSALIQFSPGLSSLTLRQGIQSVGNFSITSPGLLGMAIFDFSGIIGGLPGVGSIGNIFSHNNSTPTFVGTYAVTSVPEPSACGFAGGAIGLGFAAWKKMRAQTRAGNLPLPPSR